jgi:hypothetical protein
VIAALATKLVAASLSILSVPTAPTEQVVARPTRVDGGRFAYACTIPKTQAAPTIKLVPIPGQACAGWLANVPGGNPYRDRSMAARAALRLAGPHCAQDSTLGRTWAPQELNDAIAKYFPPGAWEAVCDVSWGEARFQLESISINGCCIGPMQVHKLHQPKIAPDNPPCREPNGCPLWTWEGNVKAAFLIWQAQGWAPWQAVSRRADAGDMS